MLKDNLFIITQLSHEAGAINAVLQLDRNHQIFCGHFPGQPVLPGACMLQIVKEILEGSLEEILQLKIAGNLKFVQLVNPQLNNIIDAKLSYQLLNDGLLQTKATLLTGQIVCFKFQGIFTAEKPPL